MLSDPNALKLDWKISSPGKVIAAVVYGAKGDNDTNLQTARLKQVETAISQDSAEATVPPSTVDFPVLPLPVSVVPADADGVMVFFTLGETMGIYAVSSGDDWTALGTQVNPPNLNLSSITSKTYLGSVILAPNGDFLEQSDKGIVDAFKSLPAHAIRDAMLLFSNNEAAQLAAAVAIGNEFVGRPINVTSIRYPPPLPGKDKSIAFFYVPESKP
jgi:hypothetical protein